MSTLIRYRPRMLRVLLDTNGVDPILDLAGALAAVEAAVANGALTLLVPHATAQELGNTKNKDRRRRLLEIAAQAKRVPDGATIIGRAGIGMARLGDPALFANLGGGNSNHVNDTLIAMSAHYERAVLVTNEGRLFKVASAQGIPTINTAAMLHLIGYSLPTE